MNEIVQIICFVIGMLIGYSIISLFGLLFRNLEKSAVNKAQYILALQELAARTEKACKELDKKIGDREISLTELFDKDKTAAADLIMLYSLIKVVKLDKKTVSKKIFFLKDPVKVFYHNYGAAFNSIPILKESI